MNKSLVSCLVLFPLSTFALNPVPGWYGGGFGGVSYVATQSNMTVAAIPTISSATTGSMKYNLGGNGGFQLGYRLKTNYRLEGQFHFQLANPSSLTIDSIQIGNGTNLLKGRSYLAAGFLNAYYDWLSVSQNAVDYVLAPYFGAGLGYGRVATNYQVSQAGTTLYDSGSKKSNGIMYQGIIGLNWHFDDFTSVGFDYRYLQTATLDAFNVAYKTHSFNVVMNFAFDDGLQD